MVVVRLQVLLQLLALLCAHAKKSRPSKKMAKSAVGFGRAVRAPAVLPTSGGFGPATRAPPVVAQKPRSSLETKLLQEHATNCATAKQTFAVCAEDSAACTYTAGWEPFLAPADAVAPGNEPYMTSELLRKSRGPLLSERECSALIDEMESHAVFTRTSRSLRTVRVRYYA